MRELIDNIREVGWCMWNVERSIFFQIVIMQRAHHVNAYQAIIWRIGKCLDTWEAGQRHIMVKETAHTCKQYLSTYLRDKLEEHQAKIFHSLLIRGKLWNAVQWITEQKKGGDEAE